MKYRKYPAKARYIRIRHFSSTNFTIVTYTYVICGQIVELKSGESPTPVLE